MHNILRQNTNVVQMFIWTIYFHSFTFDLQFLYELKHKVHLSKIECVLFHFSIPSRFY